MKKYFSILLLYILVTSCNQQPSQVERDYIKNLEEKNRILEKELQEEKTKPKSNNISKDSKQKTKNTNDYFTIGSTEDEVLSVMGDPTSYHDMGSIGKQLSYGISTVYFESGKVESYSNLGRNLKVKVK